MKQTNERVRIGCFGGIYSNYLALEATVRDARSRGVDELICLGDLGAFGAHADRVFPVLHDNKIRCVQGNYDDSIGNELDDCQCGYTDPRDNHFAAISYQYTLQNTSQANRLFLRDLPKDLTLDLGDHRLLFCHGSPRRTNEFLWESTTSTHFLQKLANDSGADMIAGTHSGIRWHRRLNDGNQFVNVGVLGRPENDGKTNVWYTIIEYSAGEFQHQFIPIEYDYRRLAKEMRQEKLPDEFVETIQTGWWTTCLEILPSRERRCGKW